MKELRSKNPLDFLEDLALSEEWDFERAGPHDLLLSFSFKEMTTLFTLFFRWDIPSEHMLIQGSFDVEIPADKRYACLRVLSALSLDTCFGAFLLDPTGGLPLYRYTFILPKTQVLSLRFWIDITEDILFNAEKLLQAFRLLLVDGKTPEEAMFAAFMDVAGEA